MQAEVVGTVIVEGVTQDDPTSFGVGETPRETPELERDGDREAERLERRVGGGDLERLRDAPDGPELVPSRGRRGDLLRRE